jgi:phosphoglycolate phosphatase
MVGDSDIDVLTARAAGARSVGCRFGLAPHSLESAEPDYLVDSASEWVEIAGADLLPLPY